MASSYTTRLRLELQGDGENADTWGDKANAVFTLLDEAIDGYLAVDVAGSSNVTLTTSNSASDQSRQRVLKLTGVLTGDIDVIAPAVEKQYVVWNATSGDFDLTFKPSGGTGIVIPQGYFGTVFTDAATMYQAAPWIRQAGGFADVLTAQTATTSGTTVDFTGLSGSTIKRITLLFDAVSTDGTDNLVLRLGDAGGIEGADYAGAVTKFTSAPAITISIFASEYILDTGVAAATAVRGRVVLENIDGAGSTWAVSGQLARGSTSSTIFAGTKAVSGTLTQIRLTTENGTDSFDAGAISLLVEHF